MSEIRENSENNNNEEIQKIDIMNLVAAFWNGFRRLWVFMLVIVIVCTARSYFSTTFPTHHSMLHPPLYRLLRREAHIQTLLPLRKWRLCSRIYLQAACCRM